MLLDKVVLEFLPSLVYWRLLIPSASGIGEIARDKYEIVGCGHDLFRRVWDFPRVVKFDRCLNLIDNFFGRIFGVMWCIYPCHVNLDVLWVNIVVTGL